jgi:ketosteroid isomerase-like protein
MSQENVAVVRRVIEAFNRGEIDAAVRGAHPDVEVDWSRSRGVEAGIYRGRMRTARFWETFYESFDRIVVTPEELIEHGDYVIMRDRTRLWGRDGIEVAARNVSLVTVRDGLIVRWRLCRDMTEALTAAGMAEHLPGAG